MRPIKPKASQAVVLAIAAEGKLKPPWPELLVAIAFVWGFATDWFFVSVALVWGAIRLAIVLSSREVSRRRVRRLIREFFGPAVAALLSFGFYGWQLTKHNLWGQWRAKLALRTFSTADGAEGLNANFVDVVWGYAREQYGQWGIGMLYVAFAFALLYLLRSLRADGSEQRDPESPWSAPRATFVAVAAFAPLLHTWLLKNHSYLHDFSVLKFAVPLCCIPLSLVPHTAIRLLGLARARAWLTVAAATIIGLSYVGSLHRRYPLLVPPRNPEIAKIGDFVHRNTGYDDVVFSSFLKAEPYPSEPHLLSHTLKLIHQVTQVEEMAQWLDRLPAHANVVWLEDESRKEVPLGGADAWANAQRTSEGSLSLLRLRREDLLNRLREAR